MSRDAGVDVVDGKTHKSFAPKNLSRAPVTSSEWVTVISCPAPSTVRSSDDGMRACIIAAYLYGTVRSSVPCEVSIRT